MHPEARSLNVVWLSRTSLTNLNSGEGGSNYIDVKRYRWMGTEYPYVSGQAMRHVLREAIRREIPPEEACVADDQGVTCGQIERCVLCDLFGYMKPREHQGAVVRVSPLKVSPAMGLLPADANGTVDFLTRRHRAEEAGGMAGDIIVNVEMGLNVYKAGLALDLERVSVEETLVKEEPDEKETGRRRQAWQRRTLQWELRVESRERDRRIRLLLEALTHLTDFSKQARALTDFSPDLMLVAAEPRYSHRLQKALEVTTAPGRVELDLDRIKAILAEIQPGALYVGAGSIPGVVDNQPEVDRVLEDLGVERLTPTTLIQRLMEVLQLEGEAR